MRTKFIKDTYKHVLHYTSLFGGVQAFTVLMSFVRNKFAAIFIGSVGLGLIDIYNRAVNLFSSISALIAPMAVVQTLSVAFEKNDVQLFANKVRIIRSWSLLTAIVGWMVALLCAPLLSYLSFNNWQYSWQFAGVSLLIPLAVLSGTELSILKAARQLKKLAFASFWAALILAAVTIPFYMLIGVNGIVPALVMSSSLILLVQLCYTLPLYPWHAQPFSFATLKQGKEFIQLSLYYLVANMVASVSEFGIRSYMVNMSDVNTVGLYSAGLLITVTAARFLFVAMDADYFPRLSGLGSSVLKTNYTVNRQLEVCVLLIAPFLIIFDLMMPYVIRLLYVDSFLCIAPMAIFATFYMFLKATNIPIAYISLARGDGKLYLLMEVCYYIEFVLLMVACFYWWGIDGAGIALSLSNLIELVMLLYCFNRRYHFRFSYKTMRIIGIQATLVILGVSAIFIFPDGIEKYLIGIPLFLLSVLYSVRTLVR